MGTVAHLRVRAAVGAVVAVALVGLSVSGCSGDEPQPTFSTAAQSSATPAPATSSTAPLSLAITPAKKSKNLPISTEIGIKLTGGTITKVSLTDTKGGSMLGSLREDGSSWVPAKPLRYGRSYTATVTATGPSGQTSTASTSFTTRSSSGPQVGTGLYLFDGSTYGVAMPVVVEFSNDIPEKARAGVEKRLFVHSEPPQPGVWHWFGARQVLYRPPAYWQPGTRLTVRIALEGQPMGGGRFGDTDRSATVTIGAKVEMKVDNKTKKMSVYRNDKLIKTMPVSLGKPSTPSSSGTMVIMDKKAQTVFDTRAELGPVEGYRVDIAYAQRLTWGGQFIHAAPWSVGDQGHRNVSHGCVNISMGNARWLFNQTSIGDPVTVRGTGHKLDPGDGWTAWDMSWSQYVKGSALPVPAELAAATGQTTATPSAGAGPTGTPTPALSTPTTPTPASPAAQQPAGASTGAGQ